MNPRRQLALTATVQILTMAVWFSTSSVSSAVAQEFDLSGWQVGVLTSAVQFGFVFGAVASAVVNLADRLPLHWLMASSAALAAALNAAVVFTDSGPLVVVLRFLTGVALSGIYPVGLRLMTTWYTVRRAHALGILVGALTLGSAAPHVIRALSDLSWRPVLLGSSALAILGGILSVLWVRAAPRMTPSPPLDPGYVRRMFQDRTQRLINLGYLGHMWELYALWAWLPAFVGASMEARAPERPDGTLLSLLVFTVVGPVGAIGCVAAGRLAVRRGPVPVARAALVCSGTCCFISPLLFGASPWLLVPMLLIWGASVIADSAQFSSALSEHADPRYVGTALTAQTAMGFALTIVTIQGLPVAAEWIGWRFALVALGLGPLLGTLCMTRLLARQPYRDTEVTVTTQ